MEAFVRGFGAKAFRRPLFDQEVARYSKLFTKQANASRSFNAGAQLVVEAMLQSPNFLLRTENGVEPKWRPYETASRLSYFLWNTMPGRGSLPCGGIGRIKHRRKASNARRGACLLTRRRAIQ